MKYLLIAEKPSLMRTIESVYNKHRSEIPFECDFYAQAGHLLTLKFPGEIDEAQKEWCWENLPFHPENFGGWAYKKTSSEFAQKKFAEIKAALNSGEYDGVIHAGDPDQEGQLLVDETLKILKNTLPIKRFWSNDTTEPAVLESLKNLRDYNEPMQKNLLAASYARQHSDYRVGMNLSRAVGLKMNLKGASIGRVKTPMLSIVCEREEAIRNFVPTTVYGVRACYTEGFNGQYFNPSEEAEEKDAKEKEDEAQKGVIYFDTKEEANEFIKALSDKATVEKFEAKKVETYAPKLFKLATAQVAAGKMGYTPDKTLAVIQSLYEKGYLSYPRTDCEHISSHEDLHSMVRSAMNVPDLVPFIKTITASAIERVRKTKKWVNDKELEKHGHSALCPTTKAPDFSSLSKEEKDIYALVCRQFVAIFLPPVVQNKTVLVADVDGNKFKSTGKTLVDAGYSKIFGTTYTDMEIPVHKNGDVLLVEGYECTEKTSKCPPHITETDLVQICESPAKYLLDKKYKDLGERLKIGTSATRASIIKELLEKKYLQNQKIGKKDYLVPTPVGQTIYDNLKDCIICRVDMTGEWEVMLEDIREGTLAFADYEKNMMAETERLVNDIRSAEMKSASGLQSAGAVVGKCPKCGGDVLSSAKFFACANRKIKAVTNEAGEPVLDENGKKKYVNEGCNFGAFKVCMNATISDKDFGKMLKGEAVVKKLKNKEGKSWDQAIKYNVETMQYEFAQAEVKEVGKCPKCNGRVLANENMFTCENRKSYAVKDENGKPVLNEAGKPVYKTEGCEFAGYKSIMKAKLTNADVSALLGGESIIKKLTSKEGKSWDQRIKLNFDDMKFEFVQNEAKEADYSCPCCGLDSVMESDYFIECTDCGFKFWKTVASKRIPEEEIMNLVSKGKTGTISGFKSKEGKSFSAKLVLNSSAKVVEFKFEKSKKRKWA